MYLYRCAHVEVKTQRKMLDQDFASKQRELLKNRNRQQTRSEGRTEIKKVEKKEMEEQNRN